MTPPALSAPAHFYSLTTLLTGPRIAANRAANEETSPRQAPNFQNHRSGPLAKMSDYAVLRRFISGKRGRALVPELLRLAFPARSVDEMAAKAAPVLGLTERHVKRLAAGEHSVSFDVGFALVMLVGFETVIAIIYRDR